MITAPSIDPGRMDRRCALRYPTIARSGSGAAIESWVESTTVWARWLPQNSREFVTAQAQFAELTALVRIRFRATVEATWRARLDGVLYKLTGQPIEVGRREYLDLPLATVNPTGDAAATLQQAFEVALAEGDTSKAITWPTAFAAAPASVSVSLIIPEGGETFYLGEVALDRTATGTTIELGAAVPGAGYSLSIIASL